MAKPSLTLSDFERAAKELDCETAVIRAFAAVEANGGGFNPDDSPKILYERHIMARQLRANGQIATGHNPNLVNSSPGGYIGGMKEHARLNDAVKIHRQSALESCSWGLFQIMGFHWKTLKYGGIQEFVNAMYESEAKQLDAVVRFIKATPALHKAIQAKDFPNIAKHYNGPNYAINKYDTKLAAAYQKFKA